MIKWRLSDDPIDEYEEEQYLDMEERKKYRCTIYLAYTSSASSCGMRDYIRYLCEHKMINAICTTAGGIDEDIMKTLAPTFIGDFSMKGKELKEQGLNRRGNLIIPNENLNLLEQWFLPILKEMHKE